MSEPRSHDEQAAKFAELFEAARRDVATVTSEGAQLRRVTEGVSIRELSVRTDSRGTVTELYDPRWDWHPDPLVFSYTFTLRPNVVKGWNLHHEHEDRYAILQGEMMLVLYDVRPGSSTFGELCQIVLSERKPRLVNVPKNVWHADHNVGSKDVVVVNYPTIQYDHSNPDKYRLPVDTPLIPYSFGSATGW